MGMVLIEVPTLPERVDHGSMQVVIGEPPDWQACNLDVDQFLYEDQKASTPNNMSLSRYALFTPIQWTKSTLPGSTACSLRWVLNGLADSKHVISTWQTRAEEPRRRTGVFSCREPPALKSQRPL